MLSRVSAGLLSKGSERSADHIGAAIKPADEVELFILEVIQRHVLLVGEHWLDVELGEYEIALTGEVGSNIGFCVEQQQREAQHGFVTPKEHIGRPGVDLLFECTTNLRRQPVATIVIERCAVQNFHAFVSTVVQPTDVFPGWHAHNSKRIGFTDCSQLGYQVFTTQPVDTGSVYTYTGGPVSTLISLFSLVPSISSSVARLHDRGHSAWWLLWWLLPIVGWFVLLVQNAFLAGHPVPNRYGPPPLPGQAGTLPWSFG